MCPISYAPTCCASVCDVGVALSASERTGLAAAAHETTPHVLQQGARSSLGTRNHKTVSIVGFNSDRSEFWICVASRMPRPVALACEMRVWRCRRQNGAAWSPRHVRRRHTYCSKAHGPVLERAITTRSKFSGLTPIGLEISHVSHLVCPDLLR